MILFLRESKHHMKKTIAVLLLVLAPTLASADLQVGAAGLYAGTLFGHGGTTSGSPTNIPFGIEARWKLLYYFQLGMTGLYLSGASPSIAILTDIGFTLDFPPITIGAGIGPDISIGLGGARNPATTKINFKASGEVNFGRFSLGLVAFDPVSTLSELRHNWPWMGITALVTLF
jgi:hypothetical protein